MKNFCEDLKERTTQMIYYEIKDILPLTKNREKLYRKQKFCHICKTNFKINLIMFWDQCQHTGKYRDTTHVYVI